MRCAWTCQVARVLDVVNQLDVIVDANRALEQFHSERRAAGAAAAGRAPRGSHSRAAPTIALGRSAASRCCSSPLTRWDVNPLAWRRRRRGCASAGLSCAWWMLRETPSSPPPSRTPISWPFTCRCTRPRGWPSRHRRACAPSFPRPHLCAYGLYAPLNARSSARSASRRCSAASSRPGWSGGRAPGDAEQTPSASGPQVEPGVLGAACTSGTRPAACRRSIATRHCVMPDGRHQVVGYTEASRGCKHRCRHCPIVPVYDGHFRVVPVDVVLEDIARAGGGRRRAHHLRRPGLLQRHRRMPCRIVEALHAEFPQSPTTSRSRSSTCCAHRRAAAVLARHRLRSS